ncbi:hypothetical protein EC968_010672 [Mortierella alpina]|nr:hypothetical protein EC968_010672 [Mortierella alpina]
MATGLLSTSSSILEQQLQHGYEAALVDSYVELGEIKVPNYIPQDEKTRLPPKREDRSTLRYSNGQRLVLGTIFLFLFVIQIKFFHWVVQSQAMAAHIAGTATSISTYLTAVGLMTGIAMTLKLHMRPTPMPPGAERSGTGAFSQPFNLESDSETSILIPQDAQRTQFDHYRLSKHFSAHLNLLSAGSLFLLPSILPYLASALTAYATTPLSDDASTSHGTNSEKRWATLGDWRWETTWILLLPCIGVMIPLSLFKIMGDLEERSFVCPFQRWRCYRNQTERTETVQRSPNLCRSCPHQPNSFITSCPTMNKIKRIWRTLIGHPPGYGPLSLDDYQPTRVRTSSTSSSTWSLFTASPSDSDSDSDTTVVMDDSSVDDGSKQYQLHICTRGRESSLPRPRTILLTSLCIWTALMALSASMGFNTPGEKQFMYSLEQEQRGSLGTLGHVSKSIDEREQRNNVASVLDMNSADQQKIEHAVWLANEDEIKEDEAPFATIRTNIIILNKRGISADGQGEALDDDAVLMSDDDEDFFLTEDEDAMDAMTMDPEDSAVFLDFLRQLDADDQATRTAEDLQEQVLRQKHRIIIKAADELVVDSMIENDLPCGYRAKDEIVSTEWMAKLLPISIQQLLTPAGDHSGQNETQPSEHAFVYHAWWTDMMIVAVAMCLGGVLVGLAQARVVYEQILEMQENSLVTRQQGLDASAGSIVSCLVISASAACLTILMILAECWDVPSVYFSGIGIAGMILVHALVPDFALQVDNCHGTVEDDEEGSDSDTCGDEKEMLPVYATWSPPMSERRNACSLEQNRQWGSDPLLASSYPL